MLKASRPEAYKLLHDGIQALSRVEDNGIRVDEQYLLAAMERSKKVIKSLQNQMKESDLGRRWRRMFGEKAKFTSGDQLATVLRKEGFELPVTENSKKYPKGDKRIKHKTDIEALEKIEHPFIALHLEHAKHQKVFGTYLKGIQRELVNGRVHVGFHLHRAVTYRGSSSQFNFQNLPIRDPEQGALIRKCFIPSKGRRLIEVDYGGIEVCIAACYHKDHG